MPMAEHDGRSRPTAGADKLQSAVALARRLSGSRRASLMASAGDEELRVVASSGVPTVIAAHARVRLGEPVAGEVARTGRPLLINRRSARGRRASYHTNSFMSVPILLPNMKHGVLNVADPVTGERFQEGDLAALEQLAAFFARDFARDGTRHRLAQLRQQVRALHHQVVDAREEERNRVGRELHDAAGDILTRSLLNLDVEIAKLPAGDTVTRDILRHARTGLRESGGALHAAVLALRPIVLHDLGLVAALRSLAQGSQELGSCAITVEIDDRGRSIGADGHPLDEATELALYRITQEALTNVRKHARADHAWVHLLVQPRRVILTIEDDGVGIAGEKVRDDARHVGLQLGMMGMRERVEALGGTLAVGPRVGGGTCIVGRVPLRPAEDDASDDRR